MKRVFLLAPIIGLCLAQGGCSKGVASDASLVSVDGETISMDEYYKYLELKQTVEVVVDPSRLQASRNGVQTQAYTGPVRGTLGFQALRDLVNQRITLHCAKDEGVYPSKEDVDKELEFRQKRQPNFLKDLTATGMTLEKVRQGLTTELAARNLLVKGVTVTPADVQEFINTKPEQFLEPERCSLLYIVVNDVKSKDQADADLKAGQMFSVVAGRYSQDPQGPARQYHFLTDVVNQMPPKLKALVAKTDETRQTDWQQEGTQYYKFYVEKKTPSKPMKIDDNVREVVKRLLEEQRGSAANDVNRKILNKIKSSKIEVFYSKLKKQWDDYEKQLTEAINAQSAPGAPPAAGTAPGGAAAKPGR